MKLIHHVKKHGKTITLHLKKHHKKYIFGILSATLLWKGVSLIAAYALVHNLSFSFADTVHQGEGDNEEIVSEETISNNEPDDGINLDGDDGTNLDGDDGTNLDGDDGNSLDGNDGNNLGGDDGINGNGDDGNNGQSTLSKDYCPDGDYSDSYYDGDCGNSEEDENHTHSSAGDDGINRDGDDGIIGNGDNGSNGAGDGGIIGNGDDGDDGDGEGDDGKCDRGDIEITSPIGGDIVGGTFDILREFKNDDCFDTEYTIKLRTKSGQLEIFSGNSENTGFSFDSTQLDSDYYTGYSLTIYGNDTIYREEEGGDFTIDNKSPEISNIKIEYSTENKKLNIGDTITISFESDEDLKDTNINILGQSALLEEKSNGKYQYTMDFSSKNTTGKLVYGIEYSDNIGNTGYIEGYENIELDYIKPSISDFEMNYSGENEIKIQFKTDEITDAHVVYALSGLTKTYNADSDNKKIHEITLKDIRKRYAYNYSISIKDEAKNELAIGGSFYITGDKIIFTNNEIRATDLITEIGFNQSGDDKEMLWQKDSFGICAKTIDFINLDLPINGKTANVKMPKIKDTNVNKLTNAFSVVLVQKLEEKNLSQYALDEITEDLNNFLIVVKLVKDDNNECKQNMSHYYINRFRHTLEKYGLIQ